MDPYGSYLALHSIAGLVLQVGDMKKFPDAFCFENLDLFFKVSKQGPYFTTIEDIKLKQNP